MYQHIPCAYQPWTVQCMLSDRTFATSQGADEIDA